MRTWSRVFGYRLDYAMSLSNFAVIDMSVQTIPHKFGKWEIVNHKCHHSKSSIVSALSVCSIIGRRSSLSKKQGLVCEEYNLASTPSTTPLPTLLKTPIEVHTNRTIVQYGPTYIFHSILCILPCVKSNTTQKNKHKISTWTRPCVENWEFVAYRIKQNPQGFFVFLSRPMVISMWNRIYSSIWNCLGDGAFMYRKVGVRCLQDKAESTGRFGVFVKTHGDLLELPSTRKDFVDLFLGGVEREVSDIHGCRSPKRMLEFILRS